MLPITRRIAFDTCNFHSACGKLANLEFSDAPMNLKTSVIFTCIAAASLAQVSHAQSSSGNISGEASNGDTLVVTGIDTGFKRELKLDKDGKFQIRRVPTGSYQVVRVQADGTIIPPQQVIVRPGGTARVL